MTELSPGLQRLLEEHQVPKKPGEPGTVEPRCKHFGSCGGCHLQHLAYEDQLRFKTEAVQGHFSRAGIDPELVHPTLGSEDPWNYRNKVDLTAKTYDGELHLGFLPYGEKHTLIEMETCPIADDNINEALQGIREAIPRHPALKKKLISVVCRASRLQEKIGVVYHSKLKEPQVYADLTMDIMGETEKLIGGIFVQKRREHITGEADLKEKILDREYIFPLRAFFQNNVPQTERLVSLVMDLLELEESDRLLDLYSGVGLFGLMMADQVAEVILLESTPYSVEAAKRNAARFDVDNVTILKGQAEDRIDLMRKTGQIPTKVVLDPPRSGCYPAVLDTLLALNPRPRIVYVSCNPETHARDVAYLVQGGYELKEVQPVDLFPQTLHTESVALLV